MTRPALLVVIAVLSICAVGAAYLYYRERQSGVEIRIDERGVTIDGN